MPRRGKDSTAEARDEEALIDELNEESGDGDGNGDGDGDDGGDDDDGDDPPRSALRELPDDPLPAARIQVGLDDGEERVRPITRPPQRRPKPRAPQRMTAEEKARSGALRRAERFQAQAYEELDSLLANLNFKERRYEIRVERLEPDTDENGVPCTGLLYTYRQPVTVDQIRQRFGGGVFEVKVHGPHPTTGVNRILKHETFTIAGLPKPMTSTREETRTSSDVADVLRVMAEQNERSERRLSDLLSKTSSSGEQLLPVVGEALDKWMLHQERQLERERADREERRREEDCRRDKENEERRREEEKQRREEDKRREEERARREEEREERRREEERARREEDKRREEEKERKEHEREERRREEERRRDEEKQRREDERERQREEAQERQRQHEREMASVAERMKQDAERQKEYLQMVQNFSQIQIEMLTSRQESGGVEAVTRQLLALKDLKDELTGEGGQPSKVQQFTEGVQEFVQTVVPLGQQVLGGLRGGGGKRQRVQVQATVGETKPVLVDVGPIQQQPALPNPQPMQAQAQAHAQAQAQEPEVGANDFTTFQFPEDGDDFQIAVTKLIKDVDLAVRLGLPPEKMVTDVLEPFEEHAPLVVATISGMSPEQVLQFLAENVPDTWAVCSPRGEELVTRAVEVWHERGAA